MFVPFKKSFELGYKAWSDKVRRLGEEIEVKLQAVMKLQFSKEIEDEETHKCYKENLEVRVDEYRPSDEKD